MTEMILRTPAERMEFCDSFFKAAGATCVYETDGYREYSLPRDVDKELTDRPYYWLWVEQTGQNVPPTVLRMAFTDEALTRENERLREEALRQREGQEFSEIEQMFFRPPTAELLTLGSFRLDRIMSAAESRGRFCAVSLPAGRTGRIVPWLMQNVVVSYRSDIVEQVWHSIGVCLENGQVVESFFDNVRHLPLQPTAPTDILSLAKLNVSEAWDRVTGLLQRLVSNRPDEWAKSAWERLAKEERQLHTYYMSILPDIPPEEQAAVEAEMKAKICQVRDRVAPKVEIDMKQTALVGLVAR